MPQNPTLQAIFPLSSTLNIMRTLQPAFSPIPNTTSFGAANTTFAQLFYDGVEQFFCEADTCTQDLGTANDGSANWQCSNLRCTCRPGTSFCGGVPSLNLTATIDQLDGTLTIDCGAVDPSSNSATCSFLQKTIQEVFGSSGLGLNDCIFGECVRQNVIDGGGGNTASSSSDTSKSLGGGVIAGLVVIGALAVAALLFLLLGLRRQRAARRSGVTISRNTSSVAWSDLSYMVPNSHKSTFTRPFQKSESTVNNYLTILDDVSGKVLPGQMMAILGPSGTLCDFFLKKRNSHMCDNLTGAGKTSLVEILAAKNKAGNITGHFGVWSQDRAPRIGFVPQQDILPATLTVFEALLFAARLRLPENVTDKEKKERVDILLNQLGISAIRNTRIGDVTGAKARGISGGEMRRVTIGLELIASPDVLLLDEPTSGLDSVSAARVADVLHAIAHDPVNPTPVIASIHQPRYAILRISPKD